MFFLFQQLVYLHKKSSIMHQEELIKILKERRDALKVTQEHLAELSGVGLRTLKAIESGRGNPTIETLNKLADVLGLELKLEVRKTNL
jgi:transcriptional regulator with XRE-family HTH domain